ncbi:MAG TPA: glycosyltransferase family 2 protein [Sedimentisphaerales bacterium]|nr:glycosyltransferase family 2 protein [Sedimentisphaerales bacterium]
MAHSAVRQDVYLSIIAPAFNEADNLAQLVQEVVGAVSVLDKPYEVIIINDASTDQSPTVLAELMKNYPQLRVLSMKRRAGQSAALKAGLQSARGRFIATIDADLQNDPADIPGMLDLVASGRCDMVNGWRAKRMDPFLKRASTRVANFVRNRLTRENIRDSACGLKVFRRECVAHIYYFDGMHRFLPTLAKVAGCRVLEVAVNHRPRLVGKTKYGISNRLSRGLRDTFGVRWMKDRALRCEFEELER